MKLAIFASTLALIGSTSAYRIDKIGESCSGTETLQIGTQAPLTVPFALTFSADLSAKSYCYDRCGPDQTFAISDNTSDPIKLADLDHAGQTRAMTFDRRSGMLTDYENFDGGLGRVVRKALARCRAVAFRQPAALPQAKLR